MLTLGKKVSLGPDIKSQKTWILDMDILFGSWARDPRPKKCLKVLEILGFE